MTDAVTGLPILADVHVWRNGTLAATGVSFDGSYTVDSLAIGEYVLKPQLS